GSACRPDARHAGAAGIRRRALIMRSSLRWLLIASLLLSALALWWPGDVSRAVARSVDAASRSQPATWPSATTAPAITNEAAAAPRPDRLGTASLEKASFDPFVGVQPPPPPAPKPLVGPVYEPPAPPPAPPQLNYRYLGQMTDPSGQRFVYL